MKTFPCKDLCQSYPFSLPPGLEKLVLPLRGRRMRGKTTFPTLSGSHAKERSMEGSSRGFVLEK